MVNGQNEIVGVYSVALFTSLGAMFPSAHADNGPAEVRLDFAFYSPPSLVIRKFGWAEQEFAKSATKVRWVQSAGSNRALEFLAADAVDFGSTAGLAAVLSRANGNPINHEGFRVSHQSAFHGLCLAIVKSSRTPGTIAAIRTLRAFRRSRAEEPTLAEGEQPVLDESVSRVERALSQPEVRKFLGEFDRRVLENLEILAGRRSQKTS